MSIGGHPGGGGGHGGHGKFRGQGWQIIQSGTFDGAPVEHSGSVEPVSVEPVSVIWADTKTQIVTEVTIKIALNFIMKLRLKAIANWYSSEWCASYIRWLYQFESVHLRSQELNTLVQLYYLRKNNLFLVRQTKAYILYDVRANSLHCVCGNK